MVEVLHSTQASIIDPAVAQVIADWPTAFRARGLEIRRLIFDVATADDRIGPIVETLKWGQPAYLTARSKTGTTLRLWNDPEDTAVCKMLVHCQTNPVDQYRARFPETFAFEKNRAALIPVDGPLPRAALSICIALALTYHVKSALTHR